VSTPAPVTVRERMAALTPQDIPRFKERLEAERDAIRSRITARNRDIQETVKGEAGVGDSGDESIRLYAREDQTVANALDMKTLEQVERALDRIKAGSYGVSEVSGKPIPIERLEAVPYAATLVTEQPLEPD
jgi:DnaK suppressor protein